MARKSPLPKIQEDMVYYIFVDNLKFVRKDNGCKLILVYVNINFVRNKFYFLRENTQRNVLHYDDI